MDESISENQKQLIDRIAHNEGFKQYKFCVNRGSLKGDGYMGTIYVVTIEENERKLDLILKSAHTDEEVRKKTPARSAYIRENFMYNVVFKEFSKFQKEYNVPEAFDATAKYYGGIENIGEECLVLENLREIGFVMWNRQKPMDSHHVETVLAQYGKFHALSFAMKKFKPEKYTHLMENLRSVFEETMGDFDLEPPTKSCMERALKLIEGNTKATAGLNTFIEKCNEFFKETIKIKDKYSVITHGDCWCNNFMFKYKCENAEEISKTVILDWQLSTIGSPILDISYFFYACSSKHCIDNYISYLNVYYESLSAMLEQFGMNAEEVMTFEELEFQWRSFAKYGMYMAILIIKIMLAKQEEAPEIKDLLQDKDAFDIFKVDISNEREYDERILIIINHMVENGFI